MSTMNRYGARALSHMREHCPNRFRAISHPDVYFTTLGDRIAEEVFALEEALSGQEPDGETMEAKVGRKNMARAMAEERVLSELAWLPAESGHETATDETEPSHGRRPSWDPLVPDMSDLSEEESLEG
ncbi:MAG: hypothetical protein ACRD0Q_01375 [Acidimicrobiales bacterium]